ncbi:MAG: transposase, partial [Clostridia bacterium]|nr:transposase [Clostridia bacterium]
MSFRTNDSSMRQSSLFDATTWMSDREKRFLEKSWAKVFADEIFPRIDEQLFAPMYSKADSRPNTPVN